MVCIYIRSLARGWSAAFLSTCAPFQIVPTSPLEADDSVTFKPLSPWSRRCFLSLIFPFGGLVPWLYGAYHPSCVSRMDMHFLDSFGVWKLLVDLVHFSKLCLPVPHTWMTQEKILEGMNMSNNVQLYLKALFGRWVLPDSILGTFSNLLRGRESLDVDIFHSWKTCVTSPSKSVSFSLNLSLIAMKIFPVLFCFEVVLMQIRLNITSGYLRNGQGSFPTIFALRTQYFVVCQSPLQVAQS